MSVIRRLILFLAALCCWGLAIFFAASWLRAHIELGEARKTSLVPFAITHKGNATVLSASVDMNFCKWRYHRGPARIIVSLPGETSLRKSLETHTVRVRFNSEILPVTLGNLYEPYAYMKRYAAHPDNCMVVGLEQNYIRGKNHISIEITPALSGQTGLYAALYFQDAGELTAIVPVKAGITLFFFFWAVVQTLIFFYYERHKEGCLHNIFIRIFRLVPVEFILMFASVAFWKAWLLRLYPDSFLHLLTGFVSHDSYYALPLLFFELNLFLLAVFALYFLIALPVRLIRKKQKKGKGQS